MTAQEQTALVALANSATASLAADAVLDGNKVTVQSRAQAALTANAAFLALASPTNAQMLAQVQRLTRECNALIRLSQGLVADISDT